MSSDHIDFDLAAAKLSLTSFIYVNDSEGNPELYDTFHSTEHRIWVNFEDIPEYMKNAVIAIEDKRFMDHKGIDLKRTLGALINLFSGKNDYGGSTITQQLIKNLTEDNAVSLTRKIREIFRALNFEKKYSKDEILEGYLNVVNFGNGCRGVQAAAQSYFNKDIKNCSIAQCAAIAGITQNPAAYNPLIYPENNMKKRNIILQEMLSQNIINQEEYDLAIIESENMEFYHKTTENESSSTIRNWYIDTLFNDLKSDLSKELGIGENAATDMILGQGLQIYCAMDKNAQEISENISTGNDILPSNDPDLQMSYVMMDFDGRVLATIGGRGKKEGNLLFDRANDAIRQPGSAIKPIGVYAPAIDLGILNYSSMIKDQPIATIDGSSWPRNSYGTYHDYITVQYAIERSSNAGAVQALALLTPQKSYDFLKNKLKFANIDPKDAEGYAAFAAGGMTNGVTVTEITSSFQIFGNGGNYYKPYTYFKVLDRNGKTLIDNTLQTPIIAISSQASTIMNRLMRYVVTSGTGTSVGISGWNIIGKTGTTDDTRDSWFVGESPYAVAGVWIGYDNPKYIPYSRLAQNIWKTIMTKYLSDKSTKDYDYDPSVKIANYCEKTGRLSDSNICGTTKTGYYSPNNMPGNC